MTTTLCARCSEAPSGEGGHGALSYHMEGPVPGHHIYMCTHCGERWIRHYGSPEEKFAWSRYSLKFTVRIPAPILIPRLVRGAI